MNGVRPLMFDSAVVLVADADDELRSFLTEQLIADAAGVFQGCDRAQTTARVAVHRPDVLVLGDLGVTSASVDLIRAIRASTGLPTEPSADLRVIALVDSGDELAVLRAFHAGADDVADRNIGYAVLRARLLVLLGRAGSSTRESIVKVGALEVSSARRRAWLHGEPVELSGKEFALLSTLASDPTRVFTRDELLREVWGFYPGARTRTLDCHASRLRRKLRGYGDELLVNVWGVGYCLVADVPVFGERAA
jgi:DNA-binding response OmpR family regulator